MMSKVYNIDNREFIKNIPDKFYDLVVDDPPYFTGPEKRKFYGQRHSKIGVGRVDYPVIESWKVPNAAYFDEIIRISKNQIIWGVNYFDYVFPGPGRIVWDKVNQDSSYSDCEIAYCSFHDSVRLFRYMWNGMLQGKSISQGHIMQGDKSKNEKRIHPTQKPVILYDWQFSTYAKVGNKIFDPHVGSGSSRIAAAKSHLSFEGCEKNHTHFLRQEERWKQSQRILKLF